MRLTSRNSTSLFASARAELFPPFKDDLLEIGLLLDFGLTGLKRCVGMLIVSRGTLSCGLWNIAKKILSKLFASKLTLGSGRVWHIWKYGTHWSLNCGTNRWIVTPWAMNRQPSKTNWSGNISQISTDTHVSNFRRSTELWVDWVECAAIKCNHDPNPFDWKSPRWERRGPGLSAWGLHDREIRSP